MLLGIQKMLPGDEDGQLPKKKFTKYDFMYEMFSNNICR